MPGGAPGGGGGKKGKAAAAEPVDKAAAFHPRPAKPTGLEPCVYAAYAGARAAAIIAEVKGSIVALTAGKGWLGHDGDAETVLLPRPSVSEAFRAVGGALKGAAVAELAVGHSHIVARTAAGELFSWGRGDSGELGHGSLSDRSMPKCVLPAPKAAGYSAVAAGSYFTAAIASEDKALFDKKKSSKAVAEALGAKWAAAAAFQKESHKAHVPPKPVVVEAPKPAPAEGRSEERRVGKEC